MAPAQASPPTSSALSTESCEKATATTRMSPVMKKASWISRFLNSWRKTKIAALLFLLLGIIAIAIAVPVTEHNKAEHRANAAVVTSASGVTLLVDNDLEGETSNRSALILLGPRTYAAAVADCVALGEELWGADNSSAAAVEGIKPLLDYLVYLNQASATSRFWIGAAGGDVSSSRGSSQASSWRTLDASGSIASSNSTNTDTSDMTLPALCTQSAPYTNHSSASYSSQWTVSVSAAVGNASNGADGMAQVTGFRDHNSFRFLGLRYAAQPDRFTYSQPFWNRTTSQAFNSSTYRNTTVLPVVNATKTGSACAQLLSGSEDCLFLNIFTPYLPPQEGSAASTKGAAPALRPVMFWIHGGGFTGGTGSDASYDGGNLASRGDVVVVTINYRLSTLGYLALDSEHGGLNGNYGLGDQILALDWVRDNIASFGGDPKRITIAGQSAGAGSVRAIMASPLALGKFAAALPMSNLGGLNYGTSYSEYYTIPQEMEAVGNAILDATNCTSADVAESKSREDAIVDCLRAVPASELVSLSSVARYIVVDGTYIVSNHLQLNAVNTTANNTAAPYALLMGTMRDDGAPFIDYPPVQATMEDAVNNKASYLAAQGYDNISNSLFPIPTTPSVDATRNLYNMSSRLSTDAVFRCIDEATVHAGLQTGIFDTAYYYEFDRSYQTPGWPGTGYCTPPATSDYPNGDLSLPYFRCHSGDLYYAFGNVARMGLPWRDAGDQPFSQFVLDSFTSFVRTYSPNPDAEFLEARGFTNTTDMLQKSGEWTASTKSGGASVRLLDWPASSNAAFREQRQCDSLGLGLSYYL